jgi:hypothetical protein
MLGDVTQLPFCTPCNIYIDTLYQVEEAPFYSYFAGKSMQRMDVKFCQMFSLISLILICLDCYNSWVAYKQEKLIAYSSGG